MNSFQHYKSQFASSSPCIAIGKSVRASLELYAQRQGHFRLPQISNSENQSNWWKIFKNFRGSSSFLTHKTSFTKKYGIIIFSRLLRPKITHVLLIILLRPDFLSFFQIFFKNDDSPNQRCFTQDLSGRKCRQSSSTGETLTL